MRIVLALLNLLGFPGVGTILAGHRRTGVIQLFLGLSGFALTLAPFLFLGSTLDWQQPESIPSQIQNLIDPCHPSPALLPVFLLSLLGMILFFGNWLWSATTTGRHTTQPPPLPGSQN